MTPDATVASAVRRAAEDRDTLDRLVNAGKVRPEGSPNRFTRDIEARADRLAGRRTINLGIRPKKGKRR